MFDKRMYFDLEENGVTQAFESYVSIRLELNKQTIRLEKL